MADDTGSSIAADAYPLDWPLGRERTDEPEESRFYSSGGRYGGRYPKKIGEARDFMEAELERLAKDESVELEHFLFSSNIRRRKSDGMPYANAKQPDDAGVALYFQTDGEQRCFAIDRYDRVADNMWAIGRTIEAFRQIARDGGSRDFHAAYDAATGLLPEQTSGEAWWDVLGVAQDATEEEVDRAYRRKAKTAHTDRGGEREEWDELQRAYDQASDAVAD